MWFYNTILIMKHDHPEIRALGDLKSYIEENGWLHSKGYKVARFGYMGKKTVEYFNDILGKHGIEPFEPLIKE